MVNRYLEKIATRRWPATVAFGAGGSAIGAGVGYIDAKAKGYDKKKTKKNVVAGASVYGAAGAIGHRLGLLGKRIVNQGLRHGRDRGDPHVSEVYKRHRAGYNFKAGVGPDYRAAKQFGVHSGSFKTKAEFDAHFRKEMQKHHPDRHKGSAAATKKFQDMSVARDRIHKSKWYKKLK